MLISQFQAKPLLARRSTPGPFRTSLDLNLTKIEALVTDDGVQFGSETVRWDLLQKIAKEERKVFLIEGGEVKPCQIFSETTGWVRTLCATESAPTVLVSGIPMHRIKDTDPMQDTREKMKALGVQKGRVLDTATGLGYTAIAAARAAKEVVTIELDPAAIELARLNPWSQELFIRSNITQLIGDAIEIVAELPSASFSAVIHDPPTMALGGELYSEDFYLDLKRVMTHGGKLFHYICDPTSNLGKRLWPGVIRRLSHAGFKKIERHPNAYGLTALS
jgi:predicted methyltransferase